LEIPLSLPPVREGVVLGLQLRVEVFDGQAQTLADDERPLWLFPRDPFINRGDWLEGLKITLYDPEGATRTVFDEAGIPYHAPRTSDALHEITEGIIMVGEGVSFQKHRGLAESLARAAARGVPVLCLAPAAGELPVPGTGDQPPVEGVELRRRDVIRDFDKRLDADYWPPPGKVAKSGLGVVSRRGSVVMEVADSPEAWPWRRRLGSAPAAQARPAPCGGGQGQISFPARPAVQDDRSSGSVRANRVVFAICIKPKPRGRRL
jgi:hypothetical protein